MLAQLKSSALKTIPAMAAGMTDRLWSLGHCGEDDAITAAAKPRADLTRSVRFQTETLRGMGG